MTKYFLLAAMALSTSASLAQKNANVIDSYYRLLRKEFNQDNAYKTTGFVEQRWRVPGNTGFTESIYEVEKVLQKGGFKKEVKGEADGPLTYRVESREMKRLTWEPIDATVTIEGEQQPVLKFATNRNMLAMYSGSTPAGGVTAELVYVTRATMNTIDPKTVAGKIVFGEGSVGSYYQFAVKNGALGAMGYSMPAYTKPETHVNSIQFSSISNQDSTSQKFGIVLSYQAKERLKAALAKGVVKVHVETKARIYKAAELTIVANARGSLKPYERFVFSAHVQEPGANDNATGVGTLAEMARVTATLIKQKKFDPKRTITFLWGDEIQSTARYIKEDTTRAKGIKWGMSLDMVGEDIAKTGGTFLIEKMPDPSAIWTRGEEKHTEWGGSVLKESDMFPHYFNDLLLNRCLQQAKSNGWIVKTNPFEGGSDHTPFLQAKIPGLLMWHFTDVYYHTDADRLDMVSPEEMKNVGISGLATAYTLASANEATTATLIAELQKSATDRLQVEYQIGLKAVTSGTPADEEKHKLDVWAKWYTDAIGKMKDINVTGETKPLGNSITNAQSAVAELSEKLKAGLK
ncbi:M28 family peptidase [Mucilaginibacter myungsuensis]|uniref:Carboxypeptidase Q n=1 Tax=Mucilaginibacter myungsuensis TaxID=649104 RepID=A0A929L2I6_9SPHI|nr:M28 family peptidase [Mucilaginibacter myungsuensis]MBE9662041.1 M28 family peptidase [Mucilaginibacter myungsuensis]MDN3599526.1 M28 family peptidase [Mucilaginibacter myungsuensis]